MAVNLPLSCYLEIADNIIDPVLLILPGSELRCNNAFTQSVLFGDQTLLKSGDYRALPIFHDSALADVFWDNVDRSLQSEQRIVFPSQIIGKAGVRSRRVTISVTKLSTGIVMCTFTRIEPPVSREFSDWIDRTLVTNVIDVDPETNDLFYPWASEPAIAMFRDFGHDVSKSEAAMLRGESPSASGMGFPLEHRAKRVRQLMQCVDSPNDVVNNESFETPEGRVHMTETLHYAGMTPEGRHRIFRTFANVPDQRKFEQDNRRLDCSLEHLETFKDFVSFAPNTMGLLQPNDDDIVIVFSNNDGHAFGIKLVEGNSAPLSAILPAEAVNQFLAACHAAAADPLSVRRFDVCVPLEDDPAAKRWYSVVLRQMKCGCFSFPTFFVARFL
eukprot:TRINITY_DN9077_c0_g1_i1.p1 TRINITY_DN9077_c0_g1~~TRINITY_DN9077_c0_g1_i1.p1  ORF type:complete len:386 (+),score=85.11 TRINITY_DN9077_c0_g1_i1:92-1249(+)